MVPLSLFSMQGKTLRPLMPILEIEGERFVMLTPQMASRRNELGAPVTQVEHYRFEIIADIDFLLTGS